MDKHNTWSHKFLGENIKWKRLDIGLGNFFLFFLFLDITLKAQTTKEKIDKYNKIRRKCFAQQKKYLTECNVDL